MITSKESPIQIASGGKVAGSEAKTGQEPLPKLIPLITPPLASLATDQGLRSAQINA